MLKYLFSGLGVVMLLVLVISYLLTGHISVMNIHLTAYGFILAGLGHIIEELKKKEKTSADHLKYVLAKNQKELTAEIKTIRTLVFSMEERKTANTHVGEGTVCPTEPEAQPASGTGITL